MYRYISSLNFTNKLEVLSPIAEFKSAIHKTNIKKTKTKTPKQNKKKQNINKNKKKPNINNTIKKYETKQKQTSRTTEQN